MPFWKVQEVPVPVSVKPFGPQWVNRYSQLVELHCSRSPVVSSLMQMSKVATVAVLLGWPVPPLAEVTGPVVLFLIPGVVSSTSTLRVQLPPAATIPPVKIRLVLPGAGAKVPPQVSVAFGGLFTIIPLGNVSV